MEHGNELKLINMSDAEVTEVKWLWKPYIPIGKITIKPRLLAAGADCTKVIVIDESHKELTLSDKRIEEAIIETSAQLLIIDPLQAYLGSGVDMHRANEIRPDLVHNNYKDQPDIKISSV